MVAIDFEFYSLTGSGAIQGQGYLYRNGNKWVTFVHRLRFISLTMHSTERPRLVRLISPTNATIHDLILVDSPKFHLVLDFVLNVEVYHLTIRGANLGSYDGIDAIGSNYYIHDNEVRRIIAIQLLPLKDRPISRGQY